MPSSMQQAIDLKPELPSGNEHIMESDCTAGVATMPPSEAQSRNGACDEDMVAETCSLFQDASVLVGMHPDQARCYWNAAALVTGHESSRDVTLLC